MPDNPPPGGAATINGIIYQLLWSLFRASSLRVINSDINADGSSGTQARILLEPSSGGDVQELTSGTRIVQQLKSKPSEGTWSLQEIILGVLPDLYLSVDLAEGAVRYEFVTAGKMGGWNDVYGHFLGLRDRCYPENDILSGLDDQIIIKFTHRTDGDSPFWSRPDYTERAIFERIASSLAENPTIAKKDADKETIRRKLWHLLSQFAFRGGQTALSLEWSIDRALLDMVASGDEIASKRRSLLLELAELASHGNAIIDPDEFFTRNGLTAVPWSHWETLRAHAQERLEGQMKRYRYYTAEDVRNPITAAELALWPDQVRALAMGGESGQGKSWRALSLALRLSEANPVIFFEASGNARGDIEEAGRIFSEEIARQDNVLSLQRITARLREVASEPRNPWLFVIIDRLLNVDEARELALYDWEGQGIALVVTGPQDVIETFAVVAAGRVHTIELNGFSDEELRTYLCGGDLELWFQIDPAIRDTLHRPLLAYIYRDLPGQGSNPTNEYGLYDRCWQQVFDVSSPGFKLAAVPLRRLALTVLDGAPYPWTIDQISDSGMSGDHLQALLHRGWLRQGTDGRYSVWHDRLLNWTIALALVAEMDAGRVSGTELARRVGGIWGGAAPTSNPIFGYIPMDVIWLLANRSQTGAEALPLVFEEIEGSAPLAAQQFYQTMIPPIGPTVVGSVLRRVQSLTYSDPYSLISYMVRPIATLKTLAATEIGTQFLSSGNYGQLMAACILLQGNPADASLVGGVWQLLSELDRDPKKFDLPTSSWALTAFLVDEAYKALKAWVSVHPEWLEAEIHSAIPGVESIQHLGYLLASVPGGDEIWERCKSVLLNKLPPNKLRCYAVNIRAHSDHFEIPWLESKVSENEDHLGSTALYALARLNTDAAVLALGHLSEDALYLTRSWCLRSILLRRHEAATRQLLTMAQSPKLPSVARSLQGQEDWMTAELLDVMLNAIQGAVEKGLNLEQARWLLSITAEANCLELFETFEKRRGTALERGLTNWLIEHPRQTVGTETLVRDPAMAILEKIGGEGLPAVVNAWLSAGDRYSTYDIMPWAIKYADEDTSRRLRRLAATPGKPHGGTRYHALEALGRLRAWDTLVESLLESGAEGFPLSLEQACAGICFMDTVVAPAAEAFDENDGRHAGAILSLGIGGRSDYLQRILTVAEAEEDGTQVQLMCVLALGMLDDPQGISTDFLIRALTIENLRFHAVNALLREAKPVGLRALAGTLAVNFRPELAWLLLQFPDTCAEALEKITHYVTDQGRLPADLLQHLLEAEEHEAIKRIFGVQPVLEQTVAQVFDPSLSESDWSKALHIKAIALVDPELAFRAARLALNQSEGDARELYPYLLSRLGQPSAIPLLFDQLLTERPGIVRNAIARALAECGDPVSDLIVRELVSTSPSRRIAACRIAAYRDPDPQSISIIQGLTDDRDKGVATAAERSLWMLKKASWCLELANTIEKEPDEKRRWRLLTSLSNIVDPGDKGRPLSGVLTRACKTLPEWSFGIISELIEKRREKVPKGADDQDEE